MKSNQRRLDDNRGSILIIAVIFATIAAISIGSYIRLAGTEMRMANQQFYANASLNLAEAGVEEALYALNRSAWNAEGWHPSDNANRYRRTYDNIELGDGAVGTINVDVRDARFSNPVIYAQGTVRSGGGNTTLKQIQVDMGRRSLFANGLTSRNNVTFSGGRAYVASYRSSDPDMTTLDGGSVASVSIEEDSVDVGNGTIYGSVSTGGEWPNIRNGMVYGADTPEGVDVDPDRVSTDFESSFPVIEHREEDGHQTHGGAAVLESDGSDTTKYFADSINLADDDELIIRGDVSLRVDGDVTISDNARIVLEEGAKLTMYVLGDFHMGGNGMANLYGDPNPKPENMIVYGTAPESQEFSLAGNAAWHGAIYAPNASVGLLGGGDSGVFRGAIVADHIRMTGGSEFYYDEDLGGVNDTGDFGAVNLRELFGDDRRNL